MLAFKDERRLLVIGDRAGTGKSTLLRRLKFNCRWVHPVPVSLVLLEENPNTPDNRQAVTSPIEFVNWFRSDLTEINFPRYDFLNEFRVNFLWPGIAKSLDNVQAQLEAARVEMKVESVQGGVVAGTYIANMNVAQRDKWARPDQERLASQKCVEAFLLDLRDATATRSVVLLIDTYNKNKRGLHEWILDEFIRPLLLLQTGVPRAEKLLVVLAGQEAELPPFQQMLGERYDRLVASRRLLGWEKEHVRQFLEVHDLEVSDRQFEYLYSQVQDGGSIKEALEVAELFVAQRKAAS